MTVIRPNSVSGITSITAQANEINFFRSNGTLAGLQLNGVNFNTTTGVSTFNNLDVGGVLTYQDVTNVDSIGIVTARSGINITGGNITLGDSGSTSDDRLVFGAGSDLSIYHNGSNSYIDDSGTGNLFIRSNEVRINKYTNEYMIRAIADGAVELYHDNSKKFNTSTGGGTLTGDFTVTGNIYGGNHITIQDSDGASDILKIGASEDLRIYHYNNNSYIRQHTDLPLIIGGTSTGQSLYINPKDGENSAIFKPNGAVELYYDNTKRIETTNIGAKVNCDSSSDGLLVTASQEGTVTVEDQRDSSYKSSFLMAGSGPVIRNQNTNTSDNTLAIQKGGSTKARWDGNGHYLPGASNTYDMGSTTLRWRNIYTNDLNLSNEGSTNSVDNTWGNYTIQEGESDLFLINNRNGKKYKFNLTEVN